MCTCVDVKPEVAIGVHTDLHAIGGGYYSRGATIECNTVFQGGYYLRGATKQRRRLLEEIWYMYMYYMYMYIHYIYVYTCTCSLIS